MIRLLARVIASSTEWVTGTEANRRWEAKAKWFTDGGGRRVSGSLLQAPFGLLQGIEGVKVVGVGVGSSVLGDWLLEVVCG